MGREAELSALFKLKNSPENKQVLDNVKGDIQRALGQFSMKGGGKGMLTPKMLSMMSPADKASFQKQGELAAQSFSKGWKKYAQIGLGAATALFNPWIGSRLLSDAVKPPGGGKGGSGVAGGIFGAGGAMGFAEFYLAINIFKKAIEKFNQSVQKGFDIYTKSAQQGINSAFYTKRQIAADVLGVTGNPNDVFRFGSAVNYVMSQTKDAARILSDTARPLAELEMHFRILKTDMSSLFAKLSNDAAPAINSFVSAIDSLIKSLTSYKGPLDDIQSSFANFMNKHVWHGALSKFVNSDGKGGNLPPLLSTMKQLPASAMEHAGLVIGGGGISPATQTARNTGIMVKQLQTIAQKLGATTSGFGLSPRVSNP